MYIFKRNVGWGYCGIKLFFCVDVICIDLYFPEYKVLTESYRRL